MYSFVTLKVLCGKLLQLDFEAEVKSLKLKQNFYSSLTSNGHTLSLQ